MPKSNDIEKNLHTEKNMFVINNIAFDRHGSFFSSSKLELNQIVLLLHLWSKIYPREIIMKDFEFSRQTITD
ncbi:hypothetical protein HZS_7890 [Henneguya salminicola]|nr:hypothetical protein HZS_7890 [Henneguya salminicola]